MRSSHGGCRAEQALAVARGVDDAQARAVALAELAKRLPAGQQPGMLREALSAARGVDDAGRERGRWRRSHSGCRQRRRWWSRAASMIRGHARQSLAEVAQRLPADEQPECARRGVKGRARHR